MFLRVLATTFITVTALAASAHAQADRRSPLRPIRMRSRLGTAFAFRRTARASSAGLEQNRRQLVHGRPLRLQIIRRGGAGASVHFQRRQRLLVSEEAGDFAIEVRDRQGNSARVTITVVSRRTNSARLFVALSNPLRLCAMEGLRQCQERRKPRSGS